MHVEIVPIDSILQDPANVRLHDEKNLNTIKASLKRFGQQKNLVVDQNNIIRAGNGTWAAAKALGWKEISIYRTTLTGAEAVAYAIADNRTSDLSEFDPKPLLDQLESLKEELHIDLSEFGFDAKDLRGFEMQVDIDVSQTAADGSIQDVVPPIPAGSTTRTGDLWIMGNHRLLCGDSAVAEDMDRLVDGSTIHMVNADPPYNVKVHPRSNNALAAKEKAFGYTNKNIPQNQGIYKGMVSASSEPYQLRAKDRALLNDFISDEDFDELLMAWFGNISRVLMPGGTFYIWGGYSNCTNYPQALKACKLYFAQSIIWVKGHPVLVRKDFLANHEWCFYGWKEGAGHRWFGPNNVTDVWEVKKINPQSMIHITEKPVELAVRAIQYSSKTGENVLDLFGGSGSTMMGAEQMGRNSFSMEMDPPYCDVIVMRWQNFTHKEAILESTGKTFSEMVEARKSEAVEPEQT
jgi:DNA modification methylase